MRENESYPVEHVILMVILVISAIVGSIATSVWIRSLVEERHDQVNVNRTAAGQ
jgi:hypothetical protein